MLGQCFSNSVEEFARVFTVKKEQLMILLLSFCYVLSYVLLVVDRILNNACYLHLSRGWERGGG